MDTVSSHDSTDTVRMPGELRHPRVVGTVFLVLALVGLVLLIGWVRNAPAESGRYGQLDLTVVEPYRWPAVTFLALLGVAVTAFLLLVVRRPANRTVVVVLVVCLAAPVIAGALSRGDSAFSGGVGCIPPLTRDEVRAAWADRPTVGEVLTGGLLQGNVADSAFLSGILDSDPSAGGCAGL